MTTGTLFMRSCIIRGKFAKTLTNTLLGIMLVAFLAVLGSADAHAQTGICRQYGFQENRANFNGYWEMGFSTGATRHIAKLLIKGNSGASITEYYDSNLNRKRRIKQALVLCQSTVGVVILGFRPTDMDTNQTGRSLTYSADNFVISRQPDGKVVAFNRDDSGTLAQVDVKYLRGLDR